MAFLDNSGDIILDAVLTDTGRFRLAKGDGSFKIVKYAFADDEIDYNKYDKDHASGSAYYDLDILKTPVLEAFTNNTSNMKHKLLSIPRTNLLYLPIIKLNTETAASGFKLNADNQQANNQFIVTVDKTTNDRTEDQDIQGLIRGFAKTSGGQGATINNIVLDQGLHTTAISHEFALDPDLTETRYIIEIDNRLGSITDDNGQVLTPNYIDDDNVASYTVTQNSTMVTSIGSLGDNAANASVIDGPRGTRLKFSIAASIELNSSTFLFTKLGSSSGTFNTGAASFSSGKYYNIDTVVKVTGGSTGRTVDIPVRFIKLEGDGS